VVIGHISGKHLHKKSYTPEMLTNFATIGEGFARFLGGSLAFRLGPFFAKVTKGRLSAFPGGSFDFRWGILKLWWAVGVW
jgi:hypothetical protein